MDIKIVDAKELRGKQVRAKDLRTRRVRGADGTWQKRYVLDTSSPTFSEEFLKVFQLNVSRARRAQRRKAPTVAAE